MTTPIMIPRRALARDETCGENPGNMPRRVSRISFAYENPLRRRLPEDFFDGLPRVPGVYFMLDEAADILYIGKAKSLRARLFSYRNAKPGLAPEHVLEMLERVARIRFEQHETEAKAYARENELLHAIRPPFNIASTEPANYLFIGLRYDTGSTARFRLTSREEDASAEGLRLYGCFRNRQKTKAGYTALLRLLHAATTQRARFHFPAKISRASPPYTWTARLPAEWRAELDRFLSGTSDRLLHLLFERMLEAEHIPTFMHQGIQADLRLAREFYAVGPRSTRNFRRASGRRARTLTQDEMDEQLSATALR